MQSIIPGVYTFDGLIVGRVYLIEDPDGLTLIDAGIAPSANKIKTQIEAHGRTLNDVKRILITHAHPDHVGALPKLKAWTRAQIVASELETPVIQGEIAVPRAEGAIRPPQTRYKPGVKVDRIVRDGDMIAEVLGGLQVVFTPGHAPGHIAFWSPSRRILFGGDVIMPRFGKMQLPYRALTVDPVANLRSVAALTAFDAQTACFGHGVPIAADAATAIRGFARRVGAV
ncbi:MAG: MBL fold metallo-hydrolase [Chloroflexota bacterium]|nr:MBL fold metallo-hydrolase [Chloroflexota bacterium]